MINPDLVSLIEGDIPLNNDTQKERTVLCEFYKTCPHYDPTNCNSSFRDVCKKSETFYSYDERTKA